MAEGRTSKAGARGHKKGFGGHPPKSSAGGPATGTNGTMPLKTRAGPITENSTVSADNARQDKSSKKNAGKKGKDKAMTGDASAPGAAAAQEDLDENAILLREIKSLGGTEEDFELLKDIDSDEEMEPEAQSSNTTADEVRDTKKASLSACVQY